MAADFIGGDCPFYIATAAGLLANLVLLSPFVIAASIGAAKGAPRIVGNPRWLYYIYQAKNVISRLGVLILFFGTALLTILVIGYSSSCHGLPI